jgi:hypothetical protein
VTSRPYVAADVLGDPAIYPTPDIIERLALVENQPPKLERLRTRAFARFKAGM